MENGETTNTDEKTTNETPVAQTGVAIEPSTATEPDTAVELGKTIVEPDSSTQNTAAPEIKRISVLRTEEIQGAISSVLRGEAVYMIDLFKANRYTAKPTSHSIKTLQGFDQRFINNLFKEIGPALDELRKKLETGEYSMREAQSLLDAMIGTATEKFKEMYETTDPEKHEKDAVEMRKLVRHIEKCRIHLGKIALMLKKVSRNESFEESGLEENDKQLYGELKDRFEKTVEHVLEAIRVGKKRGNGSSLVDVGVDDDTAEKIATKIAEILRPILGRTQPTTKPVQMTPATVKLAADDARAIASLSAGLAKLQDLVATLVSQVSIHKIPETQSPATVPTPTVHAETDQASIISSG